MNDIYSFNVANYEYVTIILKYWIINGKFNYVKFLNKILVEVSYCYVTYADNDFWYIYIYYNIFIDKRNCFKSLKL